MPASQLHGCHSFPSVRSIDDDKESAIDASQIAPSPDRASALADAPGDATDTGVRLMLKYIHPDTNNTVSSKS